MNPSACAVENILDKIYNENPEYWPHGLSVGHHDSLYLIREKRANHPVGFVGWQERYDSDTESKVGYYTIGILPEYRRNGFAKEAIQKLINIKSSSVDKVKAYIMEHNLPSKELANELGIPIVEKKASTLEGVLKFLADKSPKSKLVKGIGGAGLGAGIAALENATMFEDMPDWVKHVNQFALAPVTGALVGAADKDSIVKALLGWPAKQMGVGGIGTLSNYVDSQKMLADTNLDAARMALDTASTNKDTASMVGPLLKAIGFGGLGIGGAFLASHLYDKNKDVFDKMFGDKKKKETKNKETSTVKTRAKGDKVKIELSSRFLERNPELIKTLNKEILEDNKAKVK